AYYSDSPPDLNNLPDLIGVTVDLAYYGDGIGGAGFGGTAEGDLLLSIENIVGSFFNDVLLGDSNANTLIGLDGRDGLEGRGGNDVLDGGNGIDVAVYQHSATAVEVSLWQGIGVGGDAQGDTLISIENVFGSPFDDLLIGDDGPNELDGF